MSAREPSFIRSRCLSVLLLVLLASPGCRTRQVQRDFPTRALVPFSESGEVGMPDRWWTTFGDDGLDFQVERALGDNFELAAALQRLRAARAVARREASDFFPDVDGVFGTNATFGPGPTETRTTWGLDANYQVDLWGEIQSRVDAQRFRADATHADYHAVALSLAAEVARTWFSLIEAQAQLKLLEKQLRTNRDGLISQEARWGVAAGGGSPDVLRQRQLVESTLEQQVVVEARVEILEHQLAVLVGELPQAASFETGDQLPKLPPLPYAGAPSELLMRRPDVRRDYLAFVAADSDLASAISAQYPRLNIFGSLINSAENAETLFRDWFVSIGSQLVAPLLDGGQRRAEVDRNAAVVCQRFNEYGQTMLIAFQDVEDSLALERYQLRRIERLNAQVKLAEQASEQLRQRFITSDASYLDILSSVQSEQRLQRDILSARLDLVLIRISLYLALAGDFDPNPQMLFDGTAVDFTPNFAEVEGRQDSDVMPEPESGLESGLEFESDSGLDSDVESMMRQPESSELRTPPEPVPPEPVQLESLLPGAVGPELVPPDFDPPEPAAALERLPPVEFVEEIP